MGNQTSYPFIWDGTSFNDWAGLTSEQWEEMAGENCLTQSVYGPINHTLFLGCSISSFSASAGWNEQQSQITVDLVEDPCGNPNGKIYWDSDLQVQLWTNPDPGFIGESISIIGSPVYFRVDNFEYSGMVQSWEKMQNVSGYPTYRVVIVDPRQLLEGSHIITGEYGGGLGSAANGPYNLFNVYGYMESLGAACTRTYLSNTGLPTTDKYVAGDGGADGPMFGSDAGAFGGANVNDNGMQWSYIKNGLNLLTSSAPILTNVWSPHGRIVFRATNSTFGMGLLQGDRYDTLGAFQSLSDPDDRWLAEYYLDLSELPVAPTYWRLAGSNTSIMDAISTYLADAGYDYYIELIPIRGVSAALAASGVAKFIKVRAVKRLLQPSTNQISSFIGNAVGTISGNIGQELRNEPTTSFLIGGNKNTYYQIEATDVDDDDDPGVGGDVNDNTILPYFGLQSDGTYITPEREVQADGESRWKFTVDTVALEGRLNVIAPNATLDITELELRAARSGFDSWMTYIATMDTDTGLLIKANQAGGMWNIKSLLNLIQDLIRPGDVAPRDLIEWFKDNTFVGVAENNIAVKVQEDLQIIYSWILEYATEFYGRQYQVLVPYTCVRVDGESAKILTSESPTQTGWTDRTNILGLTNGSAGHVFLTDTDGRTETMVRFDNADNLDVSNLDQDSVVWQGTGPVDGSAYYVRCTVQDNYVYDTTSYTNPRAVITMPGEVKTKFENLGEGNPMRGVALLYFLINLKLPAGDDRDKARDALTESLEKIGNKMIFAPLDYPMTLPDAAGFGIQSEVLTYGPWVTAGPAGTVRVQHDEGLVPWEYGGMTVLNLAGNSKANDGLTYMQVGEKGSVSVPGYPILPLGAELGAIDGGFYGAGTNLIENRTAASDGDVQYTSIGQWTGLYGPNVTDISVGVGEQGVTTDYTMRTYTPKFGRFARMNAERLKQMGRLRLQQMRALGRLQLSVMTRFSRKRFKEGLRGAVGPVSNGVALNDGSPHEMFVGSVSDFKSGYKRTLISTAETKEACLDTNDDYSKKAFMSFDGLIRPVSMDGDGNLPRYVTAYVGCNETTSEGAQPPIGDLTTTYYDESINVNYLNPFSNPTGKARSTLENKISGGTYVGHDMDMLGRDSVIPSTADATGLPMPFVGYNTDDGSDYHDDYRMFAMRGPMLLQSWGYDTDGRPIPNKADTEAAASGGNFSTNDLTCYFMSEWLKKPHTWPVAPIDLRFDRARGLWVSPPSYRLVTGVLQSSMDCTDASVVIKTSNDKTLYDCDGSTLDDTYITALNTTVQCFPSGDTVIAYYNPATCTYHILEGSSPRVYNLPCGDYEDEDATLLGCFHDLVFSTGLEAVQIDSDVNDCIYKIQSTIDLTAYEGTCNDDASTQVTKRFEHLIFDDSFRASFDDCSITLTCCCSGTGISSGGITITQSTGCPPTETEVNGETYTGIELLGGLKGGADGNTAKIGLSFDVGDITDVNNITLGECLEATEDGECGAKIGFASSIKPAAAGRVWYVSDVELVGSSLIVTKQYFDYSACGTIIAEGT